MLPRGQLVKVMSEQGLAKLFHLLAGCDDPQKRVRLVERYVAEGVITVLQQQRLIGEVLLGLPRKVTPNSPGAMALHWQEGTLVLLIHPSAVAQLLPDQLIALLNHEAMHVVWRHPLRYADVADQANVKAACDVAVNQYLPVAPGGTATLSELRQLIRRPVKAGMDSANYLQVIRQSSIEQHGRLKHSGQLLSGDGQQTGVRRAQQAKMRLPMDSHRGWLTNEAKLDRYYLQRSASLQKLLTTAWQKTPKRQRGLLPGTIQQQLSGDRHDRPRWVKQLQLQLGTVPRGKEDSRARFNRRQPYRMELPGQVTRYVNQLMVFVDNSGSMDDDEISSLLSQVNELAQERSTVVTIIPFDAAVHLEGQQQLSWQKKVEYRRYGGGGTRFQSVFDCLNSQHADKAALVLIMTDGWGEKTIHNYGYRNVIWLVTTAKDELSISNPPGQVIEIQEEQ